MQRALHSHSQIAQQGQIDQVVGILSETWLAIDATLHNVERNTGEAQSRWSSHSVHNAERDGALTVVALTPN